MEMSLKPVDHFGWREKGQLYLQIMNDLSPPSIIIIIFLVSGYSVSSLVSSRGSQFYVAGAPRFNHTGKVIIFTLKNSGNLTILRALLGEQV